MSAQISIPTASTDTVFVVLRCKYFIKTFFIPKRDIFIIPFWDNKVKVIIYEKTS